MTNLFLSSAFAIIHVLLFDSYVKKDTELLFLSHSFETLELQGIEENRIFTECSQKFTKDSPHWFYCLARTHKRALLKSAK